MDAKKEKGSNFLKQGGILAAASLIVRLIGMIYRIPMANILGEKGNGIYSVAFEIYDIVLIVSSYSLPLALSKIISTQNAKGQYKNMGKTLRLSSIFALISGGGFGVLLFVGAKWIEETFYANYQGVFIPLRVLAPTIFIVAFLGVFRGFFQGKRTMVPTAISQIIEQCINAFVSVLAAYLLVKAHQGQEYESAWGAAGGTLGTCLGALAGLLFILFIYSMYRPVKRRKERRDPHRRLVSTKKVYLILFFTIAPIILSQTVFQISGLIDFAIFGNIMDTKGFSTDEIASWVGIYSSKFRLLTGVPIGISTALSSSMIPSVVSSFITKDYHQVRYKFRSTIKFSMLITIPSAIGLAVLGQPIVKLLFPSSDYVLGGRLLLAGSIAVVFFALSNVTGGALQSIDRMSVPVIHSAISLLAHIVVLLALLKFTDLGVYALVIGNVTFPLLIFIMNFSALRKYVGYRQEIMKTMLVPFSASLWMAIAIVITYFGVGVIYASNAVQVILSVFVACLVYFVVYMVLKGATKQELIDFPMGLRIYRLAKKMRLIRE